MLKGQQQQQWQSVLCDSSSSPTFVMIKSLINRFIRNAVDELFINPSSSGSGSGSASKDGSFSINFGAGDLFTDSSLNLSNLTLRKDVFNVLLEPLNLVSGHIGQLSLQGIAEALLTGGKISCTASDVYLLFDVNSTATVEEVQLARKILLELLAGAISQKLMKDLLKKIQELPFGAGPNLKNSRKVSLDLMHNLTKNFSVSVKGCHIRIELNWKNEVAVSGSGKNHTDAATDTTSRSKSIAVASREAILRRLSQVKDAVATAGPGLTGGSPEGGSSPSSGEKAGSASRLPLALAPQACDSIGVMIPYAKICPASGAGGRPEGVKKDDPYLSLSVKRVQLYCDYDCESYCKSGYDFASISQQFRQRWKTEIHTAVIPASDFEIRLALEVRRTSGLVMPRISLDLPKVRVTIDRRQVRVMLDLANSALLACRRNGFLRRQMSVYSKSHAAPRVAAVGGVHLLPQMLLGSGKAYPSSAQLPQRPDACSLAECVKRRRGKRWARFVWRAAITEVIGDVRRRRPLGRWQELSQLCAARKRYAFLYSKCLKSNAATKIFSFNVNAKVSPAVATELFGFEMSLSTSSIKQFRSVAYHICYANLFNKKKAVYRQRISQSGEKVALKDREKWDRVNITFVDLLYVQALLAEAQRQTVFDGYYRKSCSFADAPGEDSDDDLIAKIIETSSGSKTGAGSRPPSPHNKLRAAATAVAAARAVASTPNAKTAGGSAEKAARPGGSTDKGRKAPAGGGRSPQQKNNNSSPAKSDGDFFSLLFGSGGSGSTGSPNSSRLSGGSGGGGQMKAVASTVSTIIKTVGNAAGFDTFVDDIDRFLADDSSSSSGSFSQSLESLFFSAEKEDILHTSTTTRGSSDDLQRAEERDDLQQLAEPRTGGSRPSAETMREALAWALQRHLSPLAVALPDVSLHVDLVDVHMRQPAEARGSRRNILNIRAEHLDLLLQISQSDDNGPLGGKGKPPPSGSSARLVSLFGCLVQLKLTIKSAFSCVSLESNSVALANALSGLSLAGLGGDGLDSGSDDTASVGSAGPPCEDSDDDIDGGRVSDFLDAARNASQKRAVSSGSQKHSPSPSGKSARDASPAAAAAVQKSSPPAAVRRAQQAGASWAPLLTSEGPEDALTLCVILSSDNDDKGGGGLDLHIMLGGFRLGITGQVLAACSSGDFAANAADIFLLLQGYRRLLALSQLGHVGLVDLASGRAEVLARVLSEPYSLQAHKQVEAFRRYRSWLSFLKEHTPHAASCYARTSAVSIEAMSQAALAQAVLSATTGLADAAVGWRSRARGTSVDDVRESMLLADPLGGAAAAASVLASLLRVRSWEPSSLQRDSDQLVQASLPGFSVFVSKAMAPQQELRVELGGARLLVPIGEEELMHGLAAMLSSI